MYLYEKPFTLHQSKYLFQPAESTKSTISISCMHLTVYNCTIPQLDCTKMLCTVVQCPVLLYTVVSALLCTAPPHSHPFQIKSSSRDVLLQHSTCDMDEAANVFPTKISTSTLKRAGSTGNKRTFVWEGALWSTAFVICKRKYPAQAQINVIRET